VRQLVVVGDDPTSAASLLARANGPELTAVVTPEQSAEFAASRFSLFEGRTTTTGVSTAYLCERFVCALPVTTASELGELLAR